MKKVVKVITCVMALYLIASIAFSIVHAFAANPWEFRQYRNGLLCAEFTERDIVIYSPFCNHADAYLFGIAWEDTENGMEWYTFSDGLRYFGEW